MTNDLAQLYALMEAAAARSDYEEAAKLRDRISLIRSADRAPDEIFDPTGLTRQQPGQMGLGTSQQRVTPPPGWKAPQKPNPMTSGISRSRKRKR